MKVAFYAPMKSPDHAIPSGDRRMARLFVRALEMAGAEVEVISHHRSFDKSGDAAVQIRLRDAALAEADKLIQAYLDTPERRPDVMFTYHVYHKAPDWIGPRIAKALGIPYYIAEASHAPKQQAGKWQMGYAAAEEAIRAARRVFHMTKLDGNCLAPLMADPSNLVHFPPFIEGEPDHSGKDAVENWIVAAGGKSDRRRLLAVGMMRDGDKFNSYQELAAALPQIGGKDWQLLVAGDGPRRNDVEELFAPFADQVTFMGERSEAELAALYHAADLYVWPACGEAFGMAFLEAGRAGLPVVSCKIRGVPDVVAEGVGGVLVPPGDMSAFAYAIRNLLDDPETLTTLSEGAAHFIAEERSLDAAAIRLAKYLEEDVQ